MKILFLSNFYPPHHIGGYGALCQEVVEGLALRGHDVIVLTGTHGCDREITEGFVHRQLTLESDLHFYQRKESCLYPLKKNRNLRHLRSIVKKYQPDIGFIWGMWNLSKSLAAEIERLMGTRAVYYIANPWPIERNMHQAYWDMPARTPLRQRAKRVLRIPARLWLKMEWEQVPLHFEHALCCSKAQRDQLIEAGVSLPNAQVIYEGIDLAPYLDQADRRNGSGGPVLSLLFVGILAEHKGVHTIIEALTHMPLAVLKRIRVTILGTGHPDYETRLHNLVDTHDLSAYVTFHNPIPRSELPEFLGRYDVLLLPSIWSEPLARIMQEGLAAGMVVVGSNNGGTRETITDGENGLLFAGADAVALAGQIERLLNDPPLRQKLAEEGKRTAIERFDIRRMIDEIEQSLTVIAKNTAKQSHAAAPEVS